jgi:hypothetical protein
MHLLRVERGDRGEADAKRYARIGMPGGAHEGFRIGAHPLHERPAPGRRFA